MFKTDWKVWLTRFVFGAALIAVYKTFDDFSGIASAFGTITSLLAPFFYGAVIAFLLYLPSRKLEGLIKKTNNKFLQKRARSISVLSALVLFIALLAVLLLLFIPGMYKNIVSFANSIPGYLNDAYNFITQYAEGADWLSNILKNIQSQLTFDNIMGWVQAADIGTYAKGITSFIGVVVNLFLGIILSIYMLIDRASIKRNLNRVVVLALKPRRAKNLGALLSRIADVLYSFLYGQALDALFVGIVTGIILAVIQVPNAAVLGLIYGLFSLIPYFGAMFGVLTVCLLTFLSGGFTKLILAFVLITILQWIDGNIINPKIIGNAIGIKPLYVIFGVTLFGGLFGIVGMLIGPPLMAIIIELVQEFVGDRERVKAVKEGLETGDPEVDPDENPDLYVKSLNDDESHES